MSGNENQTILSGIIGKQAFRPVLFGIIFGGTGGVQNTKMLQRTPTVAHQKTCQLPAGGVEKVRLMTVGEV